MSNGMGSQDDEMTRREELRQERLREATENAAVAGSSPVEGNSATCDGTDAEEMLAAYKRTNDDDTTMTKEKQKLKSPRYSDIPAYNLEALDTDTLKNEVFPALNFDQAEKQAAGAIANNDVSGMTHREMSNLADVSKSTIGNTVGKLETRQSPTSHQREVLKFARENPELTVQEIADELDMKTTNLKRILVPYRHERIVCEVEVDDTTDETQETHGDNDDWGEFNGKEEDEKDDESDESDAVQKDLAGDDDVTYKYDTDEDTVPTTRDGRELRQQAIDDVGDLLDIFREQERRLQEVEARDVEQVPQALKGRVSSLETRVEGVQSVADRIEDQQAQVERFVEDELGRDVDFDALEEDVQDLKDQCQGITDAADLEWEETSLGQRVERIEDALETHKDAIDTLRGRVSSGDGESTSFTAEEKKNLIVALAENGEDDLIERVIEEL